MTTVLHSPQIHLYRNTPTMTDTNFAATTGSTAPAPNTTYCQHLKLSESICAQLQKVGLIINPWVEISGDFVFRAPAFTTAQNKLEFARIDAYSIMGNYSSLRHSSIGRYCSIAHKVEIGLESVDTTHVTTSWALQEPNPFAASAQSADGAGAECAQVTIGHDVWIGTHVCVLKSVTIGTGAVIGAGSIITHDVPPYAVVAGAGGGSNSHGIVRRYRFKDDVIADLLESKWWEYDLPRVQAMYQSAGRKLPFNDATEFLALLKGEDVASWPRIQNPWLRMHPVNPNKVEIMQVGDDFKLPHSADPMP